MRKTVILAAIVAAVVFVPGLAHAAAAGGGMMPWDQGLTVLKNEMTGPVPFSVGVIGFAVGSMMLIHGNDLGRFAQTLIYILMVASLCCAAPTALAALGVAGAMVA